MRLVIAALAALALAGGAVWYFILREDRTETKYNRTRYVWRRDHTGNPVVVIDTSRDSFDDAKARVGTSADPMGDALANLPPAHHLALIPLKPGFAKLKMDIKAFSAEAAKTYAAAVAASAR